MKKIEKMTEGDNRQEALAAQIAIRILRTFAFLDHAKNYSRMLLRTT